MKERTAVFMLPGCLLLFALLVGSTSADERRASRAASGPRTFEYSADFVCGVNPAPTVRVLPGDYATSVNIRNPGNGKTTVGTRVALTFPPAELQPGPVSNSVAIELSPDQAVQIDCEEILGTTFFDSLPGPPYLIGFVVIESNTPLDVAVFHTVSPLGGPVASASSKRIDAGSLIGGVGLAR